MFWHSFEHGPADGASTGAVPSGYRDPALSGRGFETGHSVGLELPVFVLDCMFAMNKGACLSTDAEVGKDRAADSVLMSAAKNVHQGAV